MRDPAFVVTGAHAYLRDLLLDAGQVACEERPVEVAPAVTAIMQRRLPQPDA